VTVAVDVDKALDALVRVGARRVEQIGHMERTGWYAYHRDAAALTRSRRTPPGAGRQDPAGLQARQGPDLTRVTCPQVPVLRISRGHLPRAGLAPKHQRGTLPRRHHEQARGPAVTPMEALTTELAVSVGGHTVVVRYSKFELRSTCDDEMDSRGVSWLVS